MILLLILLYCVQLLEGDKKLCISDYISQKNLRM